MAIAHYSYQMIQINKQKKISLVKCLHKSLSKHRGIKKKVKRKTCLRGNRKVI